MVSASGLGVAEPDSPQAECIGNPVVAENLDFAPLATFDVQDGLTRLWPVTLPEQVREVRSASWGVGVFCHVLEFLTFLFAPWSEPRRWLQDLPHNWPYVLAFVCGQAWAWWLLVNCARDPGYIAPAVAGPESGEAPEARRRGPQQAADGAESAEGPRKEKVRITPEGEIQVPLHWCATCQLLQPRRTKHCKECGYCVRTFDHHCFWIGGCIGEFNYRHFICMLVVWTAMLPWHWRLLLSAGDRRVSDPLTWCLRSWWVVLMLIGCLIHLVLIGGLLVYHTYLILTAQTTWEHMSRLDIDYLQAFPPGVFPFSRGTCGNVAAFAARGRKSPPEEWRFRWRQGEPIPFSIFENKYWSCC